MTRKLPKTLPKMPAGTVHAQMVRCGRDNCRCARGQLHGPYYYRFYRERGRLRKVYVKQAEADQTRTLCEGHRLQRRVHRAQLQAREKQGKQLYRDAATLLKELEKCGGTQNNG